MNSQIADPNEILYLLCHNNADVFHYVELTPGHVTDSGQPVMECTESAYDVKTRIDVLNNQFWSQYHFEVSEGLGKANGSAAAQETSRERIQVKQWTDLIKLVRMDRQEQAFKVLVDGKYEGGIRFEYLPQPGVTFGLQLALHRGGETQLVGDELLTSDGNAKPPISQFPTGYLKEDDLIGLVVRSSKPSTFKITSGYFRLRRIG